MRRTAARSAFIFVLLLLAVSMPIVWSGYSQIRQAEAAATYAEKASRYAKSARLLPWRADLYELAGRAYYHAEEYAFADAMYFAASNKSALSAEGWTAWGDVNYLNGDTARAREIWSQALAAGQISNELYSRMAGAALLQEEFDSAARYLQMQAVQRPQDAPAHYRLGLLLALTDPEHATSELLAASNLDPQFVLPVQTLHSALSKASSADSPSQKFVVIGAGLGSVNEWSLARAAFQSAIRADEANAEAWAWLGEANQRTGRAGDVELNRALELNSNSSVVHSLRGMYFQRIGDQRRATSEFESSAQLAPDDPARFISLGNAYALSGDLIRALDAFEYAVALAPESADYWRALAEFCGRQGIRLDDMGVPAAQRAVVIVRDADTLDTLGWLLYLAGRYPESEQALLDALKIDPLNASVRFHLGLTYLQIGDRPRAFESLIHARDLGNPDADAVLRQRLP